MVHSKPERQQFAAFPTQRLLLVSAMNPEDGRADEFLAGIIMAAVAVFGIIASLTVVYLIYRTPSFHNSFGYICASHLLADIGLLSTFLFWAAPAAIIGLSGDVTQSYAGERIGQVSMLFWYASMYGQLQLAINRLLAITTPMLYSAVFSPYRTAQILLAFWVLSFFHIVIYFWDGCNFTFDVSLFIWVYADTPCGEVISFYLDFAHGTTLCVVVIIINTATFIAICREAQKLSYSMQSNHEMAVLRKNTRFYIQVVIQSVCFAMMICSFHILSRFGQTKWQGFFMTTFVWQLAHAFDGVIFFLCYERFRRVLFHPSLLFRNNLTPTTCFKKTNTVIISVTHH